MIAGIRNLLASTCEPTARTSVRPNPKRIWSVDTAAIVPFRRRRGVTPRPACPFRPRFVPGQQVAAHPRAGNRAGYPQRVVGASWGAKAPRPNRNDLRSQQDKLDDELPVPAR